MNQRFERFDLNYLQLATKTDSKSFQILDGSTAPTLPIETKSEHADDHDEKASRRFRALKKMKNTYFAVGGSMNIDWFNGINLGDLDDQLNFPESLLLVAESGSTVGKYYCSVKKSLFSGEPCLVVHAGSCGSLVNGLECGTSVTGFVDYQMHVLHEISHEWLRLRDKCSERKFLISYEEDKRHYYCKRFLIENGETKEEDKFSISNTEMKNVITESVNIIFQRIIILQNKKGEIDLKSINSRGYVVKTNFRTLGTGYEKVRGEDVIVHGIRRTIFDGINIEEWDTIFNEFGRMVLRCQPEKDYALIPLWFKHVEEYNTKGDFVGTRPPLLWACDMELYAQYLERKELCASQHKDYLQKHTQLQAILADFMQALLIKKPTKVTDFAMIYFEPFLKKHVEPKLDEEDLTHEGDLENGDEYWNFESGDGEEEDLGKDSKERANFASSVSRQLDTSQSAIIAISSSSTENTISNDDVAVASYELHPFDPKYTDSHSPPARMGIYGAMKPTSFRSDASRKMSLHQSIQNQQKSEELRKKGNNYSKEGQSLHNTGSKQKRV